MKKWELYALVAAMIIPGLLCTANYIYSLAGMDPHAAFNRGQYRDAIRGFRRILRDKPDDTMSRVCLALTYEAAGMPQKAVEEYKQAITHNSDGLIAGLLAADLMSRYMRISTAGQQEWSQIEQAFKSAMGARGAAQNLAPYGEQEAPDEYEIKASKAALTKFIEAHPGDVPSYIGRGFAHWLSSKPGYPKMDAWATRKAVADFQAAVLLAPDDPLANFGLILTERQAAEIELRNADGESEHFAALKQALRDAVTRLPDSAVPIAGLASSPYTPVVYRASLGQVEGWVEKHPDSALTNFALAWVYATNSRHVAAADPAWDPKAEKPLKKARALVPGWKTAQDLQSLLGDAQKRSRLILKTGKGCIPGLVDSPEPASVSPKAPAP